MDLNLKGKKALVCGSSQGIGLAAAQELASLGAEITLFARNIKSLEEARDSLSTQAGQKHQLLTADFFDIEAVRVIVAEHNEYHILVNNTGGPPGGKAIEAETREYQRAFASHLLNNQIIAAALVPYMTKAGYGRIINIISTSVKSPIMSLGVSNTIRGAVNSWAKTLSGELGPYGITVNNVLPGATKTVRLDAIINNKSSKSGRHIDEVEKAMKEEIPLRRFAEASEVGAAVAFLASPAAAYINGASLPVDGGRTNCF
jgi:3-oxoacyl-[acyl-carrier protein] reductase